MKLKIPKDEMEANDILNEMQKSFVSPEKKKVVAPDLKKIPFLFRYIKEAGKASDNAMRLGKNISSLQKSIPSGALAGAIQFGGVGMAALDFLLIPIIYLSAYILKQKVPITLNNNARWTYSAIVLGLTLAAVFIPGAAPALGLAIAGLALGLSGFLLSKAISERYQLRKNLKAVEGEIFEEEFKLALIKENAHRLQSQLQSASDEKRLKLYEQIHHLHEDYDESIKKLTDLKGQELILQEKIKKVSLMPIIDKGVAVSLAALGVVGLALSLFFPPVGIGILVGVTAACLTYLAIRLAPSIFSAVKNLFSKYLGSSKSNEEKSSKEQLIPAPKNEQGSTASMLMGLAPEPGLKQSPPTKQPKPALSSDEPTEQPNMQKTTLDSDRPNISVAQQGIQDKKLDSPNP